MDGSWDGSRNIKRAVEQRNEPDGLERRCGILVDRGKRGTRGDNMQLGRR